MRQTELGSLAVGNHVSTLLLVSRADERVLGDNTDGNNSSCARVCKTIDWTTSGGSVIGLQEELSHSSTLHEGQGFRTCSGVDQHTKEGIR